MFTHPSSDLLPTSTPIHDLQNQHSQPVISPAAPSLLRPLGTIQEPAPVSSSLCSSALPSDCHQTSSRAQPRSHSSCPPVHDGRSLCQLALPTPVAHPWKLLLSPCLTPSLCRLSCSFQHPRHRLEVRKTPMHAGFPPVYVSLPSLGTSSAELSLFPSLRTGTKTERSSTRPCRPVSFGTFSSSPIWVPRRRRFSMYHNSPAILCPSTSPALASWFSSRILHSAIPPRSPTSLQADRCCGCER
mmetsp:Transcript_20938/g.47238  ORF Transcript_20938/g.47238 Transcript_20938/m.47238 type:complete len:243 (+) Transcript_20938:947-1675(+)